jgi:hypothetical protein
MNNDMLPNYCIYAQEFELIHRSYLVFGDGSHTSPALNFLIEVAIE